MKGKWIKYTDEQLDWVSKNRTMTISELHAEFCNKFNRLDVSASNLHSLRKRKGWKTGRTGRFEKGNIPHPNARPSGPNATSFKKGHRPHNWKPVGSTRITKDGYIEIKVSEPKKWAQLHILVWQEVNGEIPEGKCLNFIDGDKENVEIDNLELVTRNANLQINRLQVNDYPIELRESVRLIGKIKSREIELTS